MKCAVRRELPKCKRVITFSLPLVMTDVTKVIFDIRCLKEGSR